MTILEAIGTAIENLEAIRLPVRDADNANRVRTALALLDALREHAEQQAATENQSEDGQREADPEQKGDDEE